MAAADGQQRELRNETAVNVAGLLKAPTGATRLYRLLLDSLELDGETVAREIQGEVRLTRVRDAVIAGVEASGVAELECVRCLRAYDQPFAVAFDEEYRQTVDVRTGLELEPGRDDEQGSWIDENHELDVREPLRQEILVALPMRPECGPDCPGPDTIAGDESGEAVDERLAALASLLAGDQSNESA